MLTRLWLWFCDTLKINFKTHKTILIWMSIFVTGGIVVGVITVGAGDITAREITIDFVDRNILNSAGANTTIGQFMVQRALAVFMPMLLLFGFGLIAGWLSFVIFPIMAFQGYWMVMSLWWTANFYSMGAGLLVAFYIVFLFASMLILAVGSIWVMRLANNIRRLGFRCGCNIQEILKGLGVILGAAVLLAVLEFLVYWVFLGRLVFRNAWDLPPNLR